NRVVAHSSVGDYHVSEMLRQWQWLDPWARPRVETPEAIEELARNGLFERLLRVEARERRLDQRPDLAAMIASRREYLAVSEYVNREVYAKIHPDSVAMLDWYHAHPDAYRLPDRANVARWTLPDRASAGRLAAMLRDPAQAESLIARGRRSGVDFGAEITATSDSLLFAEIIRVGAGTVIGPDTTAGGWRVVRVLTIEDGRLRTFAEARPMVEKDMIDAVSEERVRALVTRVRRETPVRVHPRAIPLIMAAH
ncbi:MAG TPA: peptidyl-prolyl cis-trans isomerase, partial [Dongiaceae bacterium]|nr:peptidyl-prolyl cis-trans isomerase [Dongiaceae bacterium]